MDSCHILDDINVVKINYSCKIFFVILLKRRLSALKAALLKVMLKVVLKNAEKFLTMQTKIL